MRSFAEVTVPTPFLVAFVNSFRGTVHANYSNRQDGCKTGSIAIIIADTGTSRSDTPMADDKNILVRPLSKDPERALHGIDQCIAIQRAVGWGAETVPSHVFRADSLGLLTDLVDLGYVLLAEHTVSGEVVGFGRVTYTRDPEKHWLHELAVLPHAQGLLYLRQVATQTELTPIVELTRFDADGALAGSVAGTTRFCVAGVPTRRSTNGASTTSAFCPESA